ASHPLPERCRGRPVSSGDGGSAGGVKEASKDPRISNSHRRKTVDNVRSSQDSRATTTLTPATELELLDAYWRACTYLAAGMIYQKDNAVVGQALRAEQIKQGLLGHWGASPALSFVWTHLNRLIVKHDLDMMFVAGPGHGAPGVLGPAYLEGTYSEIYPDK